MAANRQRFDLTSRQKQVLCGLYLSKFDTAGLNSLGFETFAEAFNVIGYSLGSEPASIKNYRDEFDPFFPNMRKGWHKRQMREYCREIYEKYKSLDLADFTGLTVSFFRVGGEAGVETSAATERDDGTSGFARRLVTGLAAERYFEAIHPSLPVFRGFSLENTTAFGCGYDFRMCSEHDRENFLAIEVKGLSGQSGSLAMTPKEYDVASTLRDRFFLFVVRNFREVPCHVIFQNPVHSVLEFRKLERIVLQVSWLTSI